MSDKTAYCSTPDESCKLFVSGLDSGENPYCYCKAGVLGAQEIEQEYYTVAAALKKVSWLDDVEKESLKDSDPDELTRYSRDEFYPRPAECEQAFPDREIYFLIPDIFEKKGKRK